MPVLVLSNAIGLVEDVSSENHVDGWVVVVVLVENRLEDRHRH